MHDNRFDPKKLGKLNNPQRLVDIPVDVVLEKLGLPDGGVLVEIGAGTAFFSVAFLVQARAEKLYACDISEIMIDWINDNIVEQHPAIVPLQTMDDSVPLQSGIADLVFMINLHHELDDPARILSEAFRLTRPGGRVLIIDWKKEEMSEGPPLEIRCSPSDVETQLAAAGFHTLSCFDELKKHFVIMGSRD